MLTQKSKPNKKSIVGHVQNQKKIASIFISNGISSTLIIPIELARKYGIDGPSHVTIEDTEKEILKEK
jgi:hypothetical protein